MFLRKMLVIIIPLIICALLIFAFSFVSEHLAHWGFFTNVVKGLILGIALALFVPLVGARKKEPFAKLLWIPAIVLFLVILYQYLYSIGAANIEFFMFLTTGIGQTVLIENVLMGFLLTLAIRASK